MIAPIVLTGGPCAGKTTALPYLVERLFDIGFYPLVIPEVPTRLMTSGVKPLDGVMTTEFFQRMIVDCIVNDEAFMQRVMEGIQHERPLIITDRGLMDTRAYTSDQFFQEMLSRHSLDLVSARDARYSGVYHLRTAADGAEEYYSLATNPHRFETLVGARARDAQTLEAWIGHPHVRIIGNEGTFEEKLKRLFAAVCQQLGIPVPIERERKFLLSALPNIDALGPCQRINIEQFYVWTPDASIEQRYRKRGQYGSYMYVETIKRPYAHGERIETERLIHEKEYEMARTFMAPGTGSIEKDRICFVYKNQYFELDVFRGRHKGRVLLEIELTERQDRIMLPPQLRGAREVTGDERYSNRSLANL